MYFIIKIFTKTCLCFLLFGIVNSSKGQKKDLRPKLFNGVGDKISYPKEELEKIFIKGKGNTYKIALPGNFNFTGTIVSSVKRYNNLESFLIRSTILNGAIFAVSKRINDDNSISYAGRIINENYSDGYELISDASGNYYLNKIDMDELLQDR